MTASGMSSTDIRRIASADILELPEHAVVIADRSLPQTILSRVPDAILVEAGERLKSLDVIEGLALEVLQRRSSRPMTLVALGGGSIGDAVGFLASILWRGVGLWHVPTTLLAMVDSAHGGKTAVNLGPAKNQLGSFYPAEKVIIVDEFLRPLPLALRREGIVELLKALWLGDAESTRALGTRSIEELTYAPYAEIATQLGNMIDAAVAIKQRIVAADPKEERGIRTTLNLGHTLGHALELTMGLSHGSAVAWGMLTSLHFAAREGMPESDIRRCRETLFPLLQPLSVLPGREVLLGAMQRDKKRHDGQLRSVILHALGEAVVHTEISAESWIDVFHAEWQNFQNARVRVRSATPRAVSLTLEASKSELNRALIIAAQRIGRTTIVGRSSADDVTCMLRALRQLGYPIEETSRGYLVDNLERDVRTSPSDEGVTLHVCEGGTTLRFLLALCAARATRHKIFVAPALMRRPHDPLLRSLRSGGASIEEFDDPSGQGFIVRGWRQMPDAMSIDPRESSQYASAIALLAVGADQPFTLRLLGEPVSETYLEMTLAMLEDAGVETIRHGDLIALNQSERLRDKLTMEIEVDASSRAVWSVARFLGHPVVPGRKVRIPRQPDSAVDKYLATLREAERGEVSMDLGDVPDLLPVLAVAAAMQRNTVTFTGIAHLRNKESNRLDEYAETLRSVGLSVDVLSDGMRVFPLTALQPDQYFRTHGDHRLVMAGALLSFAANTPLLLDHPWSVGKSYPAFWEDVRTAGWSVEQVSRV